MISAAANDFPGDHGHGEDGFGIVYKVTLSSTGWGTNSVSRILKLTKT